MCQVTSSGSWFGSGRVICNYFFSGSGQPLVTQPVSGPGRVYKQSLLLHGLLVAMAMLLSGMGSARADTAAIAEFVHGDVTAVRSAAAGRVLAQGADIYEQDTIRTAAAARAQLRFTDGSLVSLMPETVFSVQEYRLDADGNDGSLVFNLLSGGLRTVTGAIGKTRHEGYELKTPVGTLGIRGTEYTAVLGPPDTLRVHVGRGKVVLSNDHGVHELAEGENAIMTLDGAPVSDQHAPLTSGFATRAGAPSGALLPSPGQDGAPGVGGLAPPDPSAMSDPMGMETPMSAAGQLDDFISGEGPGGGGEPGQGGSGNNGLIGSEDDDELFGV